MGRFANGMRKVGRGFVKAGTAFSGLSKTTKRVARGAALGAIIGAGRGNTSGAYSNNYRATQGALREGARSVLVVQAEKQAREKAGRFDRALMNAGLKASLTPQQLAQIQNEARTYGGPVRTIKNMPKAPSFDLTGKGARNAGRGAATGAAALGGSVLTLSAIAAMKRRRAQRAQQRQPPQQGHP